MEDVLNSGLLLLGNALLALLAFGLKKLTDWIAAKVTNEFAAGVISRADDLAIKVVRDVYQAYIKPIKDAGDGRATPAVKETAKGKAVDMLKGYLGEKGIKEIVKLLGGDGELDAFLSSLIENAVTDSKNAGKLAAAPDQP